MLLSKIETAFQERRQKVFEYLETENTDVVIIEDREGRRTKSLRYLCGQPSDGILFLTRDRAAVLVAWDVHLARRFAFVDEIIPYSDFERSYVKACTEMAERLASATGRIELMQGTPYPIVGELIERMAPRNVRCRKGGIDSHVASLREAKDPIEVQHLREASRITNEIVAALSDLLTSSTRGLTEIDLALFVEGEVRRRGAEGTGFDTLVAGSDRSYAIHPVPSYSDTAFLSPGLALIDFGVQVSGYTSDVTVPVLKHPLTPPQRTMVEVVTEAHDLALERIRQGEGPRAVSQAVDDHLKQRGFTMPHSLGHGIGLDAHESPVLGKTAREGALFRPGMVFTVEPGLYDSEHGGVRLENDVMITLSGSLSGCEVLTEVKPIVLE